MNSNAKPTVITINDGKKRNKRNRKKTRKIEAQVAQNVVKSMNRPKNNKNNNKKNNKKKNINNNRGTSNYAQLEKEVSSLVQHILLQDAQYVLPRPIGTNVAPHQYAYSQEYSPPVVNNTAMGAIVVRADPELFLEVLAPAAATAFNLDIEQAPNYSFTTPLQTLICLDYPFQTNVGLVRSDPFPKPNGSLHFDTNKQKLVNDGRYYPGLWTVTPGNAYGRFIIQASTHTQFHWCMVILRQMDNS
jgi:hypothetical protein